MFRCRYLSTVLCMPLTEYRFQLWYTVVVYVCCRSWKLHLKAVSIVKMFKCRVTFVSSYRCNSELILADVIYPDLGRFKNFIDSFLKIVRHVRTIRSDAVNAQTLLFRNFVLIHFINISKKYYALKTLRTGNIIFQVNVPMFKTLPAGAPPMIFLLKNKTRTRKSVYF